MAVLKIENPGIDGGMNIAVVPSLIDKNQVEYAIDCLFDEPGVVKRRGGTTVSDNVIPVSIGGLQILRGFTVQRTDGTIFIGLVCFAATGNPLFLAMYDQNFSNLSSEIITSSAGVSSPLVDVKPALGGGVWIGVSNQAEATGAPTTSGRQFLFRWNGANFASGTSTTLSATPIAIGDTTVTLSASPATNYVGGFVFQNQAKFVGVVKSQSGAVLTLERPATAAAAGGVTMNIRPVRGFIPQYSKGRITTSTANAIVAGAGGDFTGMNSAWLIFRSSDNAYIGNVTSVQNSTALTLVANSLQNMANEPYWAISSNQAVSTVTPGTPDPHLEPNGFALNAPGWINCVHQGRQHYANRNKLPDAAGDYVSRVWVSDTQNGEAIDFNITDGDFLQIGSGINTTGPILGMVSLQGQLLVFKESEVWAIQGDQPSNYTSRKIFSDGLLCTMAWDSWNDGVVWLGRRGLWYYDGVSAPVNLVKNTMGRKWVDWLKAFSQANGDRAYLAVLRDHAICSVGNPVTTVFSPKADQTTAINAALYGRLQPVVYIPTQALSLWSNMNHNGGFLMGGVLNSRSVLALRADPLANLVQTSGLIDTANIFNGGTPMDVNVFAGIQSCLSGTSGTLPIATITANPQLPSGIAFPGKLFVNGDPENFISYTGLGAGTFTGCTGGTGTITSGVTRLTTAPLGPQFYVASRREDANDPMLRKGWRQFTMTYKQVVGTALNIYVSTNLDGTGVAPRQNPVAPVATTYSTYRSRFGHTGYQLQWRLKQSGITTTDIHLRGTDLFWKPQRQRRAS